MWSRERNSSKTAHANLDKYIFKKEAKTWYEKLAMSVRKKMIENVPDDLNVYSILFYSILVVVMVNMIKMKWANEWARARKRTWECEKERERAGPINKLYQINSFALNQLTHRRPPPPSPSLSPPPPTVWLCMCVFIINSMMRMPFAFRKLMLSDACASLNAFFPANFYGILVSNVCIWIHPHPSSSYKSFDVANMVRICLCVQPFYQLLPWKNKTQLIDLYFQNRRLPKSIWEKS